MYSVQVQVEYAYVPSLRVPSANGMYIQYIIRSIFLVLIVVPQLYCMAVIQYPMISLSMILYLISYQYPTCFIVQLIPVTYWVLRLQTVLGKRLDNTHPAPRVKQNYIYNTSTLIRYDTGGLASTRNRWGKLLGNLGGVDIYNIYDISKARQPRQDTPPTPAG